MRRGTLALLSSFLLISSGCSYLNREIPSLNLPEPEVSTTTAGAASGAAVGAGLGLVLGSMSGEAGKGLVVGSVAGAATGGLVGRALENQENTMERQRNALAVQEEVIKEQGQDIERLREGAQDGIPSSFPPAVEPQRPATMSSNRAEDLFAEPAPSGRKAVTDALLAKNQPSSSRSRMASTYGSKSRAVPFNPNQTVSARDRYREESRRARMKAVEEPAPKRTVQRTIEKPKPAVEKIVTEDTDNLVTLDSISPIITSNSDSGGSQTPSPAKKARVAVPAAITDTTAKADTNRDEALNEVIGVLPPAKQTDAAIDEVSKSIEETKTAALAGDRCSDAQEEARKARTSPSKSNKLFYFRRAMRLCPDAPEFHLEVGYLYAALGRNDDARIEFKRVVELDPENVEAREQLSLLAE